MITSKLLSALIYSELAAEFWGSLQADKENLSEGLRSRENRLE